MNQSKSWNNWPLLVAALLLIASGLGGVVNPFTPPPIPGPGNKVLIVHESSVDGLPQSQVDIYTSTLLREWCDGHSVELKVYDQDIDTTFDDPKWRAALDREDRTSLPWLYVATESSGTSQPLPLTVAETIDVLDDWIGD